MCDSEKHLLLYSESRLNENDFLILANGNMYEKQFYHFFSIIHSQEQLVGWTMDWNDL